MKNEKSILFGIIFIAVGLILTPGLNSADFGTPGSQNQAPSTVCCKETTGGEWCQQVPEDECASSQKAPTSCDNTAYCSMGTCIDTEKGVCMSNTPKSRCDEAGGIWKKGDSSEIPKCQKGCCLMGDDVAMVTKTKCLQMASDYEIDVNFREDISDQGECFALGASQERGACVVESEYETACKMTSKSECIKNRETDKYLGMLDDPVSDVRVKFHEGKLCTNENLETDCAPTEKTICYEDRIYFVDSCGNRANVYDADLSDPSDSSEAREYWNFLQEPDCGPVTSSDVETSVQEKCGNCLYAESTKCQTPKSNDSELESGGDYVCSDLSCEYKGKTYDNGESWCAETKGTVHHIKVDEGGNILNDSKEKLKNTKKYNLPGSEYVKLTCSEGEVLEERCGSKRRFFCGEYDIEKNYTSAQCYTNPWDECLRQKSKSDCLKINESAPSYCVWLPGLRFDQKRIEGEDDRKEKQGSCVPLIAPGFEFWKGDGAAKEVCSMSYSRTTALYEVHWIDDRDKLANENWDKSRKAKRCWLNCYGIKGYGEDGFTSMKNVWEGDKDPRDVTASARQGHYCHKSGKPNKVKTGATVGEVGCVDNDDKGRKPPVFLTHRDFIKFLTTRASFLGDCGIKDSAFGEEGESNEKYQHIIQKVKQGEDGEFEVQNNYTDLDDIHSKSDFKDWKLKSYETYHSSSPLMVNTDRRAKV